MLNEIMTWVTWWLWTWTLWKILVWWNAWVWKSSSNIWSWKEVSTWWNVWVWKSSSNIWSWKEVSTWWNTLPWKWNSIERQNLVNSFGIKNYTWTKSQNIDLLNKIKWLSKEELKERMMFWLSPNLVKEEPKLNLRDIFIEKNKKQETWKKPTWWESLLPWKWDSVERQNLVKSFDNLITSFGIKNYVWSKEQNTDLLKYMKWLSKEQLKDRMKFWFDTSLWWGRDPQSQYN